MFQSDLISIRSELRCVINDGVWESCGEQDDLDVLWEQPGFVKTSQRNPICAIPMSSLFDAQALVSETLLIQHIVCFVKNKTLDVLRVDLTAAK